jgi:hypothetical protein
MKDKIDESVHDYVASQECIITNRVKEIDENIHVKITRWGNTVARKCLIEVLEVCDKETQQKILNMMDNKRVI